MKGSSYSKISKYLLIAGLLTAFIGSAASETVIDARTPEGENLDNLDISIIDTDFSVENMDEGVFDLDPGAYNVIIDHNDYRSIERTIVVDDDAEYLFTMGEKEQRVSDVTLGELTSPSTVCSRTSFNAEVEVVNRGDTDEVVSLTGKGLGNILVGQSFVVRSGETARYRFTFTDFEGLGQQSFEIELDNHDISRSENIRLTNCDIPGDPETVDNIDMQVYPGTAVDRERSKASVNEIVRVRGFADGARDSVPIEISVDGREVATVSSDRGGFFQTYFRPENSGEVTVTARSGNEFKSRPLEVVPVANIRWLNAPEKAFEGESFEVCGMVESDIEPEVVLLENDRVISTRNGNGEVCFDVTASEPGRKDYVMRALTYGESNSAEKRVNVLRQGSEVQTFPGQIQTVVSEPGLLRVTLYNTNDERTNYTVNLKEVPHDWIDNSTRYESLDVGEQKSVFFYSNPQASGDFSAVLEVESRDEIIYSDDIDFRVVDRGPHEVSNPLSIILRIFLTGLPF